MTTVVLKDFSWERMVAAVEDELIETRRREA
jgi:hypothetical protein